MTKAEAARKGGLALVEKRGKSYMQDLGRRGAEAFWDKYYLRPIGITQFEIVSKLTGEVKGVKSA